MARDPAFEQQVLASTPDASTWLSANAGSGKTRVLTDRVARLLLRGVEPQHILCLTYTKAAAAEMQNRLFGLLGKWSMTPDDVLRLSLAALGEDQTLGDGQLANARRLFARAIETPGGLRIQTIHSFCAALLRRFPLEASVSPQFKEMDDRAAKILRAEIIEELADQLAPRELADIARAYSGEDFARLMEQVAAKRASFDPPKTDAQLRALFSLPMEESELRILEEVFIDDEVDWLGSVTTALESSSPSDVKFAIKLQSIDLHDSSFRTLRGLEGIFLGGSGKFENRAKIGAFPTKGIREGKLSKLMPRLDDLMSRVELARSRRIVLQAFEKTVALHRFANVFLPVYDARKSDRGLLDFDDLIRKAKALLTDPSVAAWVLYRLDGGIDHILVDEAQDTSPDQWSVIELLTSEFTAGEGTRSGGRTLFVVGDKKQSIYSFQGADVAAFDEKHQAFAKRFRASGQGFQSLDLQYSFRSAPAILDFVDATFGDAFPGALGGQVKHFAFRPQKPGRVDLWPIIDAVQDARDLNWESPIALVTEQHHEAVLAENIAAEIKAMLAAGVQIATENGPRPVHAGDFLILVQRRSDLFSEIIRACKSKELPIAGADRLNLGAELAVKDIIALLSFLVTPQDDLSLAALLRSPLCGWTEAGLFAIAYDRKGSIWDQLRHSADPKSATMEMLNDLRGQADFMRPFDLIERALIRHDGRRKLIARLGAEAEDGIDELLSQALAYERSDVPSLTGFQIWLEADEIQVKRQVDSAGHQIRVMTVHGAKGLESEIVILPDTADRKPSDSDEIYVLPETVAVWKTNKTESPPIVVATRDRRLERADEEKLRLLYVALTRARSWLIVAGAGKAVKETGWYRLAQRGVAQLGATARPDGRLRIANGVWPEPLGHRASPVQLEATILPGWATLPATIPARRVADLSPSQLGGAKALPGELDEDNPLVLQRGTALHQLLQFLPTAPVADWPHIAAGLVVPSDLCADVLAVARNVIQEPDLRFLFGANSFAETAFACGFMSHRIVGSIDRLVVFPEKVMAIDFKSNRIVPDKAALVPEGVLRQMGAYAHALEQIYPGRQVEVAILWTETCCLMPLDLDIVRAALTRATIDGVNVS